MSTPVHCMLIGLGIWLLTGVAGQSGPGKGESRPAADKPAAKAWVSHKDPAGFSAQFPEGWQVRTDRASGRVEFQGPQGEQVVVWPIFISQAPAALNATAGAAVLRRHATKLWPNAVWENPQPAGTTAARMRGNSGDRMVVTILTWIPSPKGNAGYLYATTAPKASYRQTEETFAKILQSFRLVGTATQAAEPALSYVKWHEPRENAFTIDVPSQWRVNGGLVRVSNIDVRGALELLSPDGQIRVTVGDAEIPGFAVPNPTMAMSGIVEGSWYTPGPATTLMVRRYVPGTAFAKEYVARKVANGCSNLSFTEERNRPDAVQAVNALNAQYRTAGISAQLTAGEVAFTCRKGGQVMQGFYFAGTQLTQGYGIGMWSVQYLYGYLVASGKGPVAQEVLNRLMTSAQPNPQWVAQQQGLTAETAEIGRRTQAEISKLLTDSYWSRQGTQDELSRRRSNATLGVEDVVDNVTGTQYKIESGANYYWIDHNERIVGTDTYTRPTLDFREMVRLP